MLDELRNKLDELRPRFITELDVTTTFLASLLSKQVISDEDKATIEVSYFFFHFFQKFPPHI